jgi:sulfopyruvate decarboxylase subunit beta
MLRADALQAIYPEVQDQIVVTIMGAVAAELYTLGHRSNFFYLEHAMGLASSMGLGIALAMPRHKVVVIDGDGSLLMNCPSSDNLRLIRLSAKGGSGSSGVRV